MRKPLFFIACNRKRSEIRATDPKGDLTCAAGYSSRDAKEPVTTSLEPADIRCTATVSYRHHRFCVHSWKYILLYYYYNFFRATHIYIRSHFFSESPWPSCGSVSGCWNSCVRMFHHLFHLQKFSFKNQRPVALPFAHTNSYHQLPDFPRH